MTHEDVAKECGLDERNAKRFCAYMRARWPREEGLHCETGYAHEWAGRFKSGRAYDCSDHSGKQVLLAIDREIALANAGSAP